MTLEECKKCKYHKKFEYGAVHCAYDQNIMCMASVYNPKLKTYALLTCPKMK